MTYLVVIPFRSFGKTLKRGQLVDESEIRSPRIRYSEGKIVPAVSSSEIPEERLINGKSKVTVPRDTQKVENTRRLSFNQKA